MTKTGQAAPKVPREVMASEHGICERQPLRYKRPASPVGSAFGQGTLIGWLRTCGHEGLWTSLRLHPIGCVAHAFVAFSVAWTATTHLGHFFGWGGIEQPEFVRRDHRLQRSLRYLSHVEAGSIVITAPLSDVSIEVVFGDIFAQGVWLPFPSMSSSTARSAFLCGRRASTECSYNVVLLGMVRRSIGRLLTSWQTSTQRLCHAGRGKGAIPNRNERRSRGRSATLPAVCLHTYGHGHIQGHADMPQMFAALAGLWRTARTELGGDALMSLSFGVDLRASACLRETS